MGNARGQYNYWTKEQEEKIKELIAAGVGDPEVYENAIDNRSFKEIVKKAANMGLKIKRYASSVDEVPEREHRILPLKPKTEKRKYTRRNVESRFDNKGLRSLEREILIADAKRIDEKIGTTSEPIQTTGTPVIVSGDIEKDIEKLSIVADWFFKKLLSLKGV